MYISILSGIDRVGNAVAEHCHWPEVHHARYRAAAAWNLTPATADAHSAPPTIVDRKECFIVRLARNPNEADPTVGALPKNTTNPLRRLREPARSRAAAQTASHATTKDTGAYSTQLAYVRNY
jgi:hypothetical protein